MAKRMAERIAHDEEVIIGEGGVAATTPVNIVEGNKKVPRKAVGADCTHSALGEYPADTGAGKGPEDLLGRGAPRSAGAPAVHSAGKDLLPRAERKVREGR